MGVWDLRPEASSPSPEDPVAQVQVETQVSPCLAWGGRGAPPHGSLISWGQGSADKDGLLCVKKINTARCSCDRAAVHRPQLAGRVGQHGWGSLIHPENYLPQVGLVPKQSTQSQGWMRPAQLLLDSQSAGLVPGGWSCPC